MQRSLFRTALPAFLFLGFGWPAAPEAAAGDWSHWRGPNRNGITAEDSGWEKGAWPPAGSLWSKNVGEGASAPLVVGKQVYTFGWKDGWDIVRCLEAETGKIIWEQEYPGPKFGRHAKGDQSMYRGATSTPEFDPESGLLFTLGCDGSLNAWNTADGGKQVWSLNLYQGFDIPQRPQITDRKNTLRDYGYTSSPLVIWNQVIVEAGDRKGGCLKSFDKRTGELIWSSQNRDPAGHTGGPVLVAVDGVPCVAIATSWNLLVTRIDGDNAGKTVAEFEWKTDFSNTVAGVAVEGQDLLIASRYNQMAMARVHVSLRGAKEVWRNQYPTGVCTPVIHDGKIYFANKGIHCVDFATGKLLWEGGKIGDAGSCFVTADERLVVWGNSGDLSLVETAKRSPDKCTILSERRGIFDDMAWPHVVAANGRLFCKTLNGDLACFSLTEKSAARDSSLTSAPSGSAMPPSAPAAADWKFSAWPGSDPGLVVGWKRGDGPARIAGRGSRMRLEKRGEASFGDSGEMQLAAGGFHVKGVSDALLEAGKRSNELTIELIFRTGNLEQRGPARIVSYSEDPYIRNFTLGQERDQLTLRLRTPKTGENGSNPEARLGKFIPEQVNHVIVSYRPGEMVTFLNGRELTRSDRVSGDFSNWAENQQLILGDEWSGGSRDWAGDVFGFAIFNRAMGAKEAAERFRMAVE